MNIGVKLGDGSLIHLFQRKRFGDEPWQTASRRRELVAFAQLILHSRRLRAGIVDPDLFTDPAWDILLELLIADGSDREVAVASVGLISDIRRGTVVRYLKLLEQRNLVVQHVAEDGRETVSLSDRGRNDMLSLLDQMAALSISSRNASNASDA